MPLGCIFYLLGTGNQLYASVYIYPSLFLPLFRIHENRVFVDQVFWVYSKSVSGIYVEAFIELFVLMIKLYKNSRGVNEL